MKLLALHRLQSRAGRCEVRLAVEPALDGRFRAALTLAAFAPGEPVVQAVQRDPRVVLWGLAAAGRIRREALVGGPDAVAGAVVSQPRLVVVAGESRSCHAHKLGAIAHFVK
jgi:hypothetical protein